MDIYTLIVELSYVLTDAGSGSSAAIGGVTALMSVATAGGSVVFARLAHRTPRVLLPVEFLLSAAGFGLVAATGSVPVIAAGAVLAGLGTGMLLPTLLTWAVNRLEFGQRGRGPACGPGTLFVGEFLCPLLVAAIGAGGLRPAIGVLGGAAAVMAVLAVLATRTNNAELDLTSD